MIHTMILIAVAFLTLAFGFAVGMCITAKHADEEIAKFIRDHVLETAPMTGRYVQQVGRGVRHHYPKYPKERI